MCGIVGAFEVRTGRADGRLAAVTRAVEVMRHRGPDDEFADIVDGVGAWGMCRLAIRDPAQGRQPFWADDVGLIFNGEIYNTDLLRDRLRRRGYEFHTTCDTEVVLACYREFAEAAFGLLDGIFAAAVVDRRRGRVVLARDEFGVKPLFVRSRPGELKFASEPKALRAVGGLVDGIDTSSLAMYLRYQVVPEPHSPWVNVRRVPRGTVETYDINTLEKIAVEQFEQPVPPPSDVAPDDWVGRTAEAVETSVRRQLVSDRPLGVFLSGGIDSTLVSAVASSLHPGIRAFGISVPGTTRDERVYMEEAARHLDVDLTITDLVESDFDRLLDRIVDVYDEPFGDFSAVPTMLVSEVAARDLRVVLSGDGGDELFGGYGRYRYAHAASLAEWTPRWLARRADQLLPRRLPGPLAWTSKSLDEVGLGGRGYASLVSLRSHAAVRDLLADVELTSWPLSPRQKRILPWDKGAGMALGMAIDIDQYLPADILTKVDRATMAVSLEARVPLLGAPVARLAAEMPISVKVQDGIPKWPLKELLRRRGFGDAFLHRTKMGFSFPIEEWLSRALHRRPELVEALRNPPAPLVSAATNELTDRLLAGAAVGHQTWTVLILSLWLHENG